MEKRKASKQVMRMFSIVGLLEGISFLLLLGIAMPLKYVFEMPLAVTIVGGAHGLLFTLYIIAILAAAIVCRWPAKYYIGAFLASVLPFGPFIIDRRIRKSYT